VQSYDIGDRPRATVTFTAINGTPTNPTTVTVTVQDPTGAETSPAAVSDGAGVYHVDIDATMSGRWLVRFVGVGTVVAAVEDQFLVRVSPVLAS
jgi:hypothetical protein